MGKRKPPIVFYRYILLEGYSDHKRMTKKELKKYSKDKDIRQFIREVGKYEPVGAIFNVHFSEPAVNEYGRGYCKHITLVIYKKPTKLWYNIAVKPLQHLKKTVLGF